MTTKYFSNLQEYDIMNIAEVCEAIETKAVILVCTDKRFKVIVPRGGYPSGWTYNIIRWGFARKCRNSDFHAQQHAYCPHSYMAGVLAHLLNTAVEMGYYQRKTSRTITGWEDHNTIWM